MAEDFLKQVSLDNLGEVQTLKGSLRNLRTTVAACNTQFIEAGLAFAIKNLRATKKEGKQSKSKTGDKKDAQTMKQVITDMNAKIITGECGVKSSMVHKVLYDESSKHL